MIIIIITKRKFSSSDHNNRGIKKCGFTSVTLPIAILGFTSVTLFCLYESFIGKQMAYHTKTTKEKQKTFSSVSNAESGYELITYTNKFILNEKVYKSLSFAKH